MKPIYLEMNAFGPYAGKQVIDFRLLKDRQLFSSMDRPGRQDDNPRCYVLRLVW